MNRTSPQVRASIAQHLVEGCGVRSTSRLLNVDQNTILSNLLKIGDACAKLQDEYMRELPCKRIECDEMFSSIYCKEDNVPADKKGQNGFGDAITWIAIDPDTKLVPCYLVGKRTYLDADKFMGDLASRLAGRIQLTTDGHPGYRPAIEEHFGSEIDYAHLYKVLENALGKMSAADFMYKKRYGQPLLEATSKVKLIGNPNTDLISTSGIERFNLTVRMSLRRCSRATNAISKTYEHFKASMDLFHAHYNFCRIHKSIRCTPAMEAGLTNRVWTSLDLVNLVPAPTANRPKTYRKASKAA